MALYASYRAALKGFTLLVSISFVSSEDCVSIDQIGDSYVNEPTKLDCIGASGDITHQRWSYVKPDDTLEIVAIINFPNGVPDVNIRDSRVNCSWNENGRTSELTIRATSLDDETKWVCSVFADPLCTPQVNVDYPLVVSGKSCIKCV